MNIWNLVLKNLFGRKGRFIFTLLGISIGMASFVALLSMGGSMRGEVTRQAQAMGAHIMIMPENICVFNQMAILNGDSISELLQQEVFDDVSRIEGLTVIPHLVQKTGIKDIPSVIIGILPEKTMAFRNWVVETGEYFASQDHNTVVVGANFAGTRDLNVGDIVSIGRKQEPFQVAGILRPTLSNDDAALFMPLAAAQKVFNKEGYISYMSATIDDIAKMEGYLASINTVANVQASTDDELLGNALTILGSVNITLQLIAGVALIAAAFGIINTMMTAVYERRREIGIIQAIGGTSGTIFKIFVLESGLYGFLGGVAGVAAGLIASVFAGEFISQIGANDLLKGATPKASFDMQLIVSAIAFSLVISVLSGLYPAWKASRLTPVEAVGYE